MISIDQKIIEALRNQFPAPGPLSPSVTHDGKVLVALTMDEYNGVRTLLEQKSGPANHDDYGYILAGDRPWFFYDSEGDGMVFCKTEQEARAGAEKAIDDSLDEFWSESVDQICYGRVIMAATQCDREERPDSVDDDGIADDGDHWPEGCLFKCNYRLQAVDPKATASAPGWSGDAGTIRNNLLALADDVMGMADNDEEYEITCRVYLPGQIRLDDGSTNKDPALGIHDTEYPEEGCTHRVLFEECERPPASQSDRFAICRLLQDMLMAGQMDAHIGRDNAAKVSRWLAQQLRNGDDK